jgi:hypothetical protein
MRRGVTVAALVSAVAVAVVASDVVTQPLGWRKTRRKRPSRSPRGEETGVLLMDVAMATDVSKTMMGVEVAVEVEVEAEVEVVAEVKVVAGRVEVKVGRKGRRV